MPILVWEAAARLARPTRGESCAQSSKPRAMQTGDLTQFVGKPGKTTFQEQRVALAGGFQCLAASCSAGAPDAAGQPFALWARRLPWPDRRCRWQRGWSAR